MISQTEYSNMIDFENEGWEIRSSMSIPVIVEAPAHLAYIRSFDLMVQKPSDFILIRPGQGRRIAMSSHRALLEESLREYRDIWRSLGQK
jgi:hypothetical protein